MQSFASRVAVSALVACLLATSLSPSGASSSASDVVSSCPVRVGVDVESFVSVDVPGTCEVAPLGLHPACGLAPALPEQAMPFARAGDALCVHGVDARSMPHGAVQCDSFSD